MFGQKSSRKKTSIFFQIFLGVILVVFSLLSILAYLGKELVFPLVVFSSFFLEFIIFVIGIVFVIEGFKHRQSFERIVHIFVGTCLILFAAFPMLHKLDLLSFLPIIVNLQVNPYLLSFLIFAIGVYLVVDRVILLFSE